jgi:hypothetical protein
MAPRGVSRPKIYQRVSLECSVLKPSCVNAQTELTIPEKPAAVFHAGPSKQMNFFTTKGTGGRRAAGTRPGGDQMNGNAVMYNTGKILCVGGAEDYDAPNSIPAKAGVAKTAASIVTITAPATGNPTASSKVVAPMKFQRSFASAVVLPDGKVVVVGGMPFPVAFSDEDAVLHPGMTPSLHLSLICAGQCNAQLRARSCAAHMPGFVVSSLTRSLVWGARHHCCAQRAACACSSQHSQL